MLLNDLVVRIESDIEDLKEHIAWVKEESRFSGQSDVDAAEIRASTSHLNHIKSILKSLQEIQSQSILGE